MRHKARHHAIGRKTRKPMRYMLDTNICIYLLKRQPPHVFERFAQLDVGDVVMSCLTLAELRQGVTAYAGHEQHRNAAALDVLVEDIPALPFDAVAASAFGLLASQSKLKRNKAIDNLIAAHAIGLNLVLVTHNVADFSGYTGLKLENWIQVK